MAKDSEWRKYNRIPWYTKKDGTKVKPHVRSNNRKCKWEKKTK